MLIKYRCYVAESGFACHPFEEGEFPFFRGVSRRDGVFIIKKYLIRDYLRFYLKVFIFLRPRKYNFLSGKY